MDKLLILDYGSQTTQLIGRRIREFGVFSEILPGNTQITDELLTGVKGIILSGSPHSVNDADSPEPDHRIFELAAAGLPVLGICYGLQRMTQLHGGSVQASDHREFGRSRIRYNETHPLFAGIPESFVSWMSHGDSIIQAGEGFRVVAESENGIPACLAAPDKNMVGIQFHPEVSHCEHGLEILKNFALNICQARAEWSLDRILDDITEDIRRTTDGKPVLLLISGGVDSTVVAGLLLRALDPELVHLMYIDTGLMRLNETDEVVRTLESLGATHIHVVDARDRFLNPLEGVSDPEEKRRIIGDAFIEIQQHEVTARGIPEHAFLAQGTLYTDLIESGKGVGKHAAVIKSHHNVGSPLVIEKREAGLVIEPLASLYKDEVRAIGTKIGISDAVVHRHPFPGPGLAIRIPGQITREKIAILQQADDIYIRELKARGLYDEIWQAFAVLLPVRSVGVAGDAREYGYVLALRAIISRDGMTADVYPMPWDHLLEISARITNQVRQVGRVVYDVSSKPPATIEWE
ncbi:glutamine-hydrolyzing GMP synthase [Spirochaeta africana]|uniref:GMP synthase [glutamine-hydrolyzing] n=1 Tax=Spirochaeta africana (strain ATCC 700263 / DSM 8902 / Z-7692) TaxID=889378 RepID=H9UJH3_SPIAZ|nr:glutamine-hydrolyzing GMP synthase [Spirochaeta africana]AFG37666.1 GMP synthase (glutamine-hydrolyzing) [Spirochaeta africana DSM 8902]